MRKVSLVAPAAVPAKDKWTPPNYAEAQEAQKLVTMAGPLANYMARHQGASQSPDADSQAQTQVETLADAQPATTVASDHVGGSVVGSSLQILHRTFRVQSTVQVSFIVPAHAATPRLCGSYESFFKQAGSSDGDNDAEIEFLVLNEEQFAGFLNRRAGEATFSADDAHAQDVNTRLPPTMDQPEKYHLIFRNNSRGPARKFVQADFRMEF
jgi:tryptophan 2,3-dioxygenase